MVRHGETDWNIQERFQGNADIELNKVGILQTKCVRKNLSQEHIDVIICSPLKRTKQTAHIIAEGIDAEVIFDNRISERDFGEFEGLHKNDFDIEGYWSYKKNYSYEKAENIRSFFKRIYEFLDEIKNKYEGKNVLLVTHGGVSIPINCYFNGIPEDDNLQNLIPENCEVVKLC